MATQTFTCFPLLPKELRLQIWTETLEPRLITITTELSGFNPPHPLPRLYLVGGDWPLSHFRVDDTNRPRSPYYTVHVCASDVETPAVFSICQEPREVAVLAGYRVWTMESKTSRPKARDVMWHPKLDTILLLRNTCLFESGNSILSEIYPQEVQLIQRLAVDCDIRHLSGGHTRDYHLPHFRALSGLKEVVFLSDEEKSRGPMRLWAVIWSASSSDWVNRANAEAWIEKCLIECRKAKMDEVGASSEWESWNPPPVRVAWGKDMILGERRQT